MAAWLWLAVAIPAAGAAAVALAGGRRARALAAAAAGLGVIPAAVLVVAAAGGERAQSAFAWLPGGGLEAGLRLDPLSAVMAATVALVGFVVVVYSTGYFARHQRAPSALAGLLLFLAAMQGLVLADGFLALLVFWELVGAMSARLIAFSREREDAPGGAVRAFLTTRTADIGLYLAILALFASTGSLAFAAERPDGALGAVVGLGLVVAAMGKSAQAPLHTWLAGAMAGPTPVSALLHSATMVAAGVYLLVRAHELLAGWPLEVAGWVGAVTAVAGAAIALAQRDLKRVLAGSTTSQLGLMFVGAAAGGPAVALFHLVAHAAGKAGMFLAAGIFQHARGSTDLSDLERAGRDDRSAMLAFAVCAASIAAVPPLAAFWSKDAIVASAEAKTGWLLLAVVVAAGSAAYLLRPSLVLWSGGRFPRAPVHRPSGAAGRSRPPVGAGRATMLVGAGALAVGSIGLGAVEKPLGALLGEAAPPTTVLSVLLSLGAVAAGAAAVLARARPPRAVARATLDQLYANRAIDALVQRPLLALAGVVDVSDRRGLDTAVDGAGRATLALAAAEDRLERGGIDAAVDGLARNVGRAGRDLRRVQTGRLYEYLRDTALGAGAVAFVIVLTAVT
jgi:NADH-quinone oxidoreductase subunit L